MQNIAIFPGTFDPITNGHVDLIERATQIFDKIIVAIAGNARKAPIFSLEERIEMVKHALAQHQSVEICGFTNLLADFAHEKKASVIIRGLRAVSDFEYEFQLAMMNRKIAPHLETIFLTPAEQHSFVSSSLVREIASFGGDVAPFVHKEVALMLRKKWAIQNGT